MDYKYLIVGGGVAGTTAAETIRGLDEVGTIAILSDEPHRLYSRVLLPHYVTGKVSESQLFLRQMDMYRAKQIDFIAPCRVIDVLGPHEVLTDTRGAIRFETLLIATGGRPKEWKVGEGKAGMYYLQTLEDAIRLKMELPMAKHVVIVGGGFIGLEFAALAIKYKIPATIIIRNPWYWYHALSEVEAQFLQKILADHDIEIITNDDVVSVLGTHRVTGVVLKSGKEITADAIGLGIGLTPNISPFERFVEQGMHGIRVNEYLETSQNHIFAAGDVAEFFDPTLGTHHQVGVWANAVHHGRIAGANMTGAHEAVRQVASYSAVAVPGLAVSFVGDDRYDEKAECILRYDVERGSYGRLIIKDNRIIGGVFLNRPQDVAATMKLIESKKEIPVDQDLSQIDFDLKMLL